MLRACDAAGITPVIRAQSNPWLGYDHRMAIDLTRLQAIGAQFIMANHSSAQEIKDALLVSEDWHRRVLWIYPTDSSSNLGVNSEDNRTFVIPHAESNGAVESLDEVMDLPGIRMFFCGMSDLSRVLEPDRHRDAA